MWVYFHTLLVLAMMMAAKTSFFTSTCPPLQSRKRSGNIAFWLIFTHPPRNVNGAKVTEIHLYSSTFPEIEDFPARACHYLK
jgi:hypothetical protein